MKKTKNKAIIGILLAITSGITFLYDIHIVSVLLLAAFTSLIFFYNSKVISTGNVKLWCINIGLSIFFIYGDMFKIGRNICLLLISIWGLINFFGIYNIKKTTKKNEA